MEEDFTGLLLATSGITNLLQKDGSNIPAINWNTRRQEVGSPAIVLHLIDSIPEYADDGEAGLFSSRVQVDVWAMTFREAMEASRAVKTRVSGVKETAGDTEFQGIYIEDEQTSFEESTAGERLHRVRLDLLVMHSHAGD